MSRDAVKPLFYLPRSSRVTDFHSGLVTRSDIVGRARIRSSENLENCWNRKIRLDSSALKLHPFNIVSNRWTDISNKSSLPQVQSFLSIDTDRNKKKREKNLGLFSYLHSKNGWKSEQDKTRWRPRQFRESLTLRIHVGGCIHRWDTSYPTPAESSTRKD